MHSRCCRRQQRQRRSGTLSGAGREFEPPAGSLPLVLRGLAGAGGSLRRPRADMSGVWRCLAENQREPRLAAFEASDGMAARSADRPSLPSWRRGGKCRHGCFSTTVQRRKPNESNAHRVRTRVHRLTFAPRSHGVNALRQAGASASTSRSAEPEHGAPPSGRGGAPCCVTSSLGP
jgi:hypothetical protein